MTSLSYNFTASLCTTSSHFEHQNHRLQSQLAQSIVFLLEHGKLMFERREKKVFNVRRFHEKCLKDSMCCTKQSSNVSEEQIMVRRERERKLRCWRAENTCTRLSSRKVCTHKFHVRLPPST